MSLFENKDTREEHLQWCKDRALQYVDAGNTQEAFASMGSDLNKHDGTRNHAGMKVGIMMLMAGQLERPEDMRRFIVGFH